MTLSNKIKYDLKKKTTKIYNKRNLFLFLSLGIPSLSHFPFVIISWKHWQKEHRLNDKKKVYTF